MIIRKTCLALTLLIALGLYTGCEPEQPSSSPSASQNVPLWEQDIPPGTELVEDGGAKINVNITRRNEGQKNLVVFELTEEHGYMVDGIRVNFWCRYKDSESGEWIDDPAKIEYYVRDRLPFNETLVASTALIALEFDHLPIDLASTTDENWGAEIAGYQRAMRRVD